MNSFVSLLKLLREIGVVENIPDERPAQSTTEGPIAFLARLGLICEEHCLDRLASHLNLKYINLDEPEYSRKFSFEKFAPQISNELCWRHKIIPLWEDKNGIVAAVVNPLDMDGVSALEFATSSKITAVLAPEIQIVQLLEKYFPANKEHFDLTSDLSHEQYVEIVGYQEDQDLSVEQNLTTPPIIQLANKIMVDAVQASASDIHIEPMQYGIDVRFRIDGVMHQILEIPKRLQPYIISRFKLLAGMDIAEKRRPQDGRMRIRVSEDAIDLRASSIPTAFGEKLVLRVLRSNAKDLNFSSLGFSLELEQALLRALNSHGKMLLVTGPTGCGKTTSLYTCLHYLKDGSSNIVTVEDPIEYRIPGINQIQLNEAIDVTFPSALRSILRQDPDVIMIGEIRDGETAAIAVQAAQTGHKVLSSLHTNDAPSSITRLGNLGVQPYVLSSSLAGILAQRLARKLCSECSIDEDEKLFKEIAASGIDPAKAKRSSGCKACDFTGFKGRTGIFSYIELNGAVAELIAEQAPLSKIVQEAKNHGFCTLQQAAKDLIESGVTSFQEAKPYLDSQETEYDVEPKLSTHTTTKASEDTAPNKINSTAATSIRKQRLLLVEDEDDIRSILSILLQKEMFEVQEAQNGQEALDHVYEFSPDIVLCDLMMPVMDGKEFLKRVKSNQQTKDIPVIVLTAASTEENEISLLDLGADDFVSKTASSEVMMTRIRRVLVR